MCVDTTFYTAAYIHSCIEHTLNEVAQTLTLCTPWKGCPHPKHLVHYESCLRPCIRYTMKAAYTMRFIHLEGYLSAYIPALGTP